MSTLAEPALSADQILDLPVGYRDSRLIELRHQLFGSNIVSTANCSACTARLELSFDLEPMIALSKNYTLAPFVFSWDSDQLQMRCPSTRDVLASLSQSSTLNTDSNTISRLLKSCVADDSMKLLDVDWNDTKLQQALIEKIELHDPLGLIEFQMTCSECHHTFGTTFDIGRFLWSELDAWCQRLLGEIHTLARTYGWTEAEILSLGAWRRQVYLNMVRQ